MIMKKMLAAVAVLAATMVSGCGVAVEGSPSVDRDATVRATSPATTAEEPAADVPAESAPPEELPAEPAAVVDSGAVGIGEGVYEYKDGLIVEVSALAPYEPGKYAFGGESADSAITFVVTVTNGTAKPVDLSISTVNVNAGAAGNVAEEIYDGDLGGGFQGSVLPGKASSAAYAFAVNAADLGEIVIEIEPGFLSYDSAFFEGSLA